MSKVSAVQVGIVEVDAVRDRIEAVDTGINASDSLSDLFHARFTEGVLDGEEGCCAYRGSLAHGFLQWKWAPSMGPISGVMEVPAS
jgi:hypothetical protein